MEDFPEAQTSFEFSTPVSPITLDAATAEWPKPFQESDIQEGYSAGIAPEVLGLWLGDEKWKMEDGTIEPYCTRALFNQQGFLTWESITNMTCTDAGADPINKKVPTDWLEKIDFPQYIYRFRQKTCLPVELCMEDVTQDADEDDQVKYGDWTLEAKACGAHLKDDQMEHNTYTCESYQINLLSKQAEGGEKEHLLVSTLSYHFFENGFDQYSCPESGPSFLNKNLALPFDGSTRFVLVSPINETAIYNPCEWDCFDSSLNDNFDCPN